ncbi:uncharacterized protein PV06_11208 [Exophiala oligosperma]|uniref:Uncharacterized protein n=1 Tax=Exophiala oligosperma TaxID=215243 RepID=A0A0D2A8C2_9EURO|nr:uncharacterized protein PV06_11208 [Exophiala oligosperma]KIW36556.1 hypothetical protein PV06_11208 [Exophiala oligosperma]
MYHLPQLLNVRATRCRHTSGWPHNECSHGVLKEVLNPKQMNLSFRAVGSSAFQPYLIVSERVRKYTSTLFSKPRLSAVQDGTRDGRLYCQYSRSKAMYKALCLHRLHD